MLGRTLFENQRTIFETDARRSSVSARFVRPSTHITLARLNAATGPADAFLARHAGLASEPFSLTHMLLFESTLTRDGASYEAIARYPLD